MLIDRWVISIIVGLMSLAWSYFPLTMLMEVIVPLVAMFVHRDFHWSRSTKISLALDLYKNSGARSGQRGIGVEATKRAQSRVLLRRSRFVLCLLFSGFFLSSLLFGGVASFFMVLYNCHFYSCIFSS